MSLPKLTESIIRAGTTTESFRRGQDYYESGAISNPARQGNVLSGDCEGTSAPYYQVRVELDEAGIREAQCSCPYEYSGYCKHIVALLLTYAHHPKRFIVRKDPADLLADLNRDDLVALVTTLLKRQPELYDWIEGAISTPSSPGKTKKPRRKKVDAEVYRRQIIGILHSLDGMRMSEAYWHVGGLVDQLGEVQDTAMKFLDAGDAETALAILSTLAEEAGHAIEFVDDSNGDLSGFVADLGQPLAEAILSLDLSAVERQKLVAQLHKLDKYLSDYGMEDAIYLALEAAQRGWEDTPTRQGARPPRSAPRPQADDEEGWDEDEFDGEEEEWDEDDEGEGIAYDEWGMGYTIPRDLTEAKLNVLERQGRVNEYLALCKKAKRHLRYARKLCDLDRVPEAMRYAKKYLTAADEALRVAERLRQLKRIDDAIVIGEHGLTLDKPRSHLGEWLGPVEEAQGRTKQALKAWLEAIPEHPTLETYKTIKRLAASGWNKLRPEVMTKLRKSQDTQTLAEVLLFEEEWDEAIKVAEGRGVWGYRVVETVADAVLKHRPEWVLKVSLKNAERLMMEANSKNYPIAAEWLKRAKKAYAQLGRANEWQTYLHKLKEQYKRRPALQAQLARL